MCLPPYGDKMSILADTTNVFQAVLGTSKDKHVPFSAYLRVVPIRGKRFEIIRDMETIANQVEMLLDGICGSSEGVSFDYTKPVAFTPQFGNKQARLSFHGHICKIANPSTFTKTPVGLRTVISGGEYKIGASASNASNRQPDPQLDQLASDFKALIEATTGLTMFKLDIANVIYGLGGFHFPV